MKHAELHGPFTTPEYYKATARGFLIPNLKVRKYTGEGDGRSEILLDNRLSYIIDDTELDVVLSLVADAMAIGAGYASHGQPEKHNPYQVRISKL
jgi:hypothetical protein